MKLFYLGIILFMLPIFVFMGAAEYAVRQIPNEYKYKNDWMDQHAEEVETLILGNSHTAAGINPAFIGDKVFNLSLSGQDYMYSHYLFFKWRNRYRNLKTVIIPVSYFSFYQKIIGDNSAVMIELYYRIYMDCPFHKFRVAYNFESWNYNSFLYKIRKYLEGRSIEWRADGWSPWLLSKKSPVWNAEHVNKSLARMYLARSFKDVSCNYNYISDIADFCYLHKIKLILVSTPQTKEYNMCLNRNQIKNTEQLVQNIVHKYCADYYDYRDDKRFLYEDYCDQSHLSEIGAEKFTKLLMADIQTKDN